jgi:hypothetical protein
MLELRGIFSGLIQMSVGRVLLALAVLPAAAQAQLFQARSLAGDVGVSLTLPHSMHIEMGLTPTSASLAAPASSVFTADFWMRAYEEREQLESRYDIHLGARPTLQPYLAQQTPVLGHPQLNLVQELRWPGGKPLTGLQFERKDLLFRGDRLSIRATSDLQTLFRGVGLSGSETEVDVMSLLGWRSHSRLVWELGEPTRELHWQFSAGLDRRATTQSSSVDLQLLRRF